MENKQKIFGKNKSPIFKNISQKFKSYYFLTKCTFLGCHENKPNKLYFVLIANLFILVIAFTFSIYVAHITSILDAADATISKAPLIKTNFSTFSTFADILSNNSEKAFMAMFSGVIFGLFPVYFIYVNSQIIGIVSAIVYLSSSSAVVLAGLLPHGITESFAIILSCGYGVWLGSKFIRMLFLKEFSGFKNAMLFAFTKYIKIIIPLLIFSAIIETYVTPVAIRYFSK